METMNETYTTKGETSMDEGYASSPKNQLMWKLNGLSRFCIAPVKYRMQKLEKLGMDTTQRPVHETKKPKESERNEIISTKPPTAPPASPSLPDNKTMAFTVDIGDSAASDSSGGSANKKLDIKGPIAQFAPKHKRNLSQGKIDDKKNEEKQGEKPPVGRPRSGTIGATGRRGGYHSEGYFSSDQEDELNRRGELKSPRSTGLPSVTRSSSGESPKSNSVRVRPDSPSNTYTVPLTESANFLIERMLTATPETKRKQNGKPEGRTCCKERKPSLPESIGRGKSLEKTNVTKAYSEDFSKTASNFLDACKIDEKDDASDTGTYTIDNSPEVEEARNNIDRVFGVIQESEAELTSSTAIPNSTDAGAEEECWLSASENLNPNVSSTLSRNHPNWIEEWAYQVAEQTKPAMELPPRSSMSPRLHHGNAMSDGERPRRKLPTVPPQYKTNQEQYEATSPNSPKPRPSSKDGFRHFEPESGDSDLDFARLSCTDDERLAATLKSKLKLSGIASSSPKNLPSPTPNRRYPPPDRLLAESFDERVEEQSDDSSSETSEPYKESVRSLDNNPPLKFNRAFSLRRARLGYDAPAQPQPEKKKVTRPVSAGAKSTASRYLSDSSVSSAKSFGYGKSNVVNFGRNDGGRYSLRLSGSQASQGVVKSASKTNIQKTTKKNPRSNSTLTAKEVDFQNWKRRKNYDPMKAAAEGKKKQAEKRVSKTTEQNDASDNQSPHNSLHRSASFHGTNGAVPDMRWNNKLQNSLHYTSEEDGPLSLEDDIPRRLSSPLRRSPTSPNQLYSPKKHQYNATPARPFRPKMEPKEEVLPHFQISVDESGSEGKRSPLNSQGSGRRPKAKMEALDNLVISTIHSLSVKVRTTAESLLLKLKSQYDEEGERAALLQEVLLHLSESDQSGAAQTRSTSRELAGILRNLKKVEQSLQVIDRVLVTGEYLEDEDDIPNDWGESDY